MSTHDGHRTRMKKRFLKGGLDGFSDHEVLELLLFYCIPRRDTNEIAHRLCSQFGSFAKVLEASTSELKRVEGIGDNAATFLALVREVNRYYQINRYDMSVPLTTFEACGEYLHNFFSTEKNEAVYLLCLDAKCMVISCDKVTEGSVNSAIIPTRRIVQMALERSATYVVLSHNHPSGVATPSDEDRMTTIILAKTLYAVGVSLLDHVIVADDDYISLALSNMYSLEAVCREMNVRP